MIIRAERSAWTKWEVIITLLKQIFVQLIYELTDKLKSYSVKSTASKACFRCSSLKKTIIIYLCTDIILNIHDQMIRISLNIHDITCFQSTEMILH